MDSDGGGGESLCWGVGVATERSLGGKGDLGNTLNNKEFEFKIYIYRIYIFECTLNMYYNYIY